MENPKIFSAEESLSLITSMIREAQGKIQKNSFYFLLWGWVVAVAHLGVFLLTQLDYRHPYVMWLITIPAWIITLIKVYNSKRENGSTSHLNTISTWLWLTFGMIIFTLAIFGSKINYQLTPVLLIVSALPTVVSGIIIRFKPLVFGGISFWLFGILCFVVPFHFQSLFGALAIITGYLIPGYLLKNIKED